MACDRDAQPRPVGLTDLTTTLKSTPGRLLGPDRLDIARLIETIDRSQIGQGGPDTDRDNRWALRPNRPNVRESWGTSGTLESRSTIGFLAYLLVEEPWSVGFKSPSDTTEPARHPRRKTHPRSGSAPMLPLLHQPPKGVRMRQRRRASASAPRELDQRREVMAAVCMAQGRQIVRPKV
jgi:hypothetical protein